MIVSVHVTVFLFAIGNNLYSVTVQSYIYNSCFLWYTISLLHTLYCRQGSNRMEKGSTGREVSKKIMKHYI